MLLLQGFVLSHQINRRLKFSYTIDKYIKKNVTFGEVLKSCGAYLWLAKIDSEGASTVSNTWRFDGCVVGSPWAAICKKTWHSEGARGGCEK